MMIEVSLPESVLFADENFGNGRGSYKQTESVAGFKLKNKNDLFSAVLTLAIARIGSFFSIFRDLQSPLSGEKKVQALLFFWRITLMLPSQKIFVTFVYEKTVFLPRALVI